MDGCDGQQRRFIPSTTRKLKTAYVGVQCLHIKITTRSLKAVPFVVVVVVVVVVVSVW